MKIFIALLSLALASHFAALNVFAEDGEDPQNAVGKKLEGDLYKKILDASLLQQKVLNFQVQKYGEGSVETLRPVEALAWMYMEIGDYAEAEQLYKKALQIRKEKMPPSAENTKYIGIAYFMLGEISFLRDQYILAEDNYDLAIQYSVDPGARGDALDRKGKMYKTIGDSEKALNYYLRAVEEYKSEERSKRVDVRIKSAYKSLVDVYTGLGLRLKAKEFQDLIDEMNEEQDNLPQ